MKKRSRIINACTSILALTLLLMGASPATAASTEAGCSKNVCLGCHGPFDKLISATANYNGWEISGQVASPHRYVPHASKDIPECSNCHKPHPVPITSKKELPKANGDWCYTCHHVRVLECGTCHSADRPTGGT